MCVCGGGGGGGGMGWGDLRQLSPVTLRAMSCSKARNSQITPVIRL